MATLLQLLESHENDYSRLEVDYRQATGGELVLDPLGSVEKHPPSMSKSATILIGTYNSRESLRLTLLSVEQSSFHRKYPRQLEVVVVDDGSTDGTGEMIASLDIGLTIKYILQDHGGLTRAHNTGSAFADGDILIFCDSDIIHTEYAIEELMKRHQVLDHVTLAGFRFDVDPADPRVRLDREWRGQSELLPRFDQDFRINFPGRPQSLCAATRHWKDYGCQRTVIMANGAHYNLPAMVVGAFFSISRQDYWNMGGSDERLVGWGCEDSLIGARSIGLGNYIIPVYSAASAHLAHSRRTANEGAEFAANIRMMQVILAEEFDPVPTPGYRHRVREFSCQPPSPADKEREGSLRRPLTEGFDSMQRGTIDYALGRFDQALQHFEKAAIETPQSIWSLVGKGKTLREMHRYDDAAQMLDEAQRREPWNGWARLELALTHAAAGSYEEAHAALLAAHEAAPDLFDVSWAINTGSSHHKARGNHHAKQGLHAVAIRDFDLSLAVDPNNVWSHYDRGLSLRWLGRSREALRAFQKTDELLHPQDGNRTWVHTQLGKSYDELGAASQAKAQLERALEWCPSNGSASEALAALHARVEAKEQFLFPLTVIRAGDTVEGWLTEAESEGLIGCALKAGELKSKDSPLAVIEIGSFCGKSTIVLGRAVQALPSRNLRFYAIDPHDHYFLAGSRDTWTLIRRNIEQHGLRDGVELIRRCSTAVEWTQPIALLYIDGLHDYENVRADFLHYKDHVVTGGLVAFHDYVDYCPGVRYAVHEILNEGEFLFAGQRERLIVLKKS